MSVEDGFFKAFGFKRCDICGEWTKGKLSDFLYNAVKEDLPLCSNCVEKSIAENIGKDYPLTEEAMMGKVKIQRTKFNLLILSLITVTGLFIVKLVI